ncbi:copper amine oxidase N-terminal domain-containing protein [Paenibacillus eucommiae]|uniref:Copper amine oxidase-like N-terminal domain-containing protein n=1 Tax=Paenibacillus eucommiae TaxID=1355755 RepID=A0ABS4IWR5_9BACL|nr:copper amine oxidase N-terminal domain-containing protein [Paenibacillus eucommiae]MBP1992028.1 hypothetical protein [Paenibacillus eucommiae]
MIRKYGKRLASGLLAASLVVVAGCNSIGGVDVNKALTNTVKVKSSESSTNIAIQLIPSASATDAQKAALELVGNMSIQLSGKKEDEKNASYAGELKTHRGAVPFQVYIDGEKTAIEVDGAKKPITFNLGQILLKSLIKESGENPSIVQTLLPTISGPIMEKSSELLPLLVDYIVGNAKVNPKTLTVTAVTEKVQEESLSLNKLHTEVSGTEAAELIQKLVVSIAADEAGLQKFLGGVYDVVAPELLKDKKLNPLIKTVLENKETAVKFLSGTVKGLINGAVVQLNNSLKESKMFTDQMYIKADMYLDSDLLTRKTAIEAMIPIAKGADKGLSAIKVTATSESWNLNKPVKADKLKGSGPTLEIGGNGWGKLLNASKIISNFDKKSIAYKLLREDLQLTKKRIQMIMDKLAGKDPGKSGKPYIKDGITLVPVRFISENLDAEVEWDGKLKQVTIIDDLSEAKIVLTIGSKTALVNGKSEQLEVAAIITGESTYVPVRFIAEKLGAKVGWDDSTRTVSIERD